MNTNYATVLMVALEAWAYSTDSGLPDYLQEKLQRCIDTLSKVVIGGYE